jgi:hypothetical protein
LKRFAIARRPNGEVLSHSNPTKERTVSTAALSRHPSRTVTALSAVMALGRPLVNLVSRCKRSGKDARTLQNLPDHVLSDMGLEKMEVLTGTNGNREIWVIPHRYY